MMQLDRTDIAHISCHYLACIFIFLTIFFSFRFVWFNFCHPIEDEYKMTIKKERQYIILLGDFEENSAAAQISRGNPQKWIAYLQIIV